VEVIVLVRGGGSRSDLIWFDKEKIARAVALCPKPVLAGIGHEIDLSVADLVAHTSRKTPTAVAQFLVERAREFEAALSEAARSVRDAARDRLDGEAQRLTDAARAWRENTGTALAGFFESLSRGKELLRASARRHVYVCGIFYKVFYRSRRRKNRQADYGSYLIWNVNLCRWNWSWEDSRASSFQ
jgi:exodeoxyribonuclease VII large subunit